MVFSEGGWRGSGEVDLRSEWMVFKYVWTMNGERVVNADDICNSVIPSHVVVSFHPWLPRSQNRHSIKGVHATAGKYAGRVGI